MKSRMKALLMLALVGTAGLVSSCNTAIGFGRDIRQLGQGMENTAYGKKFDGTERSPQ